MCEMTTGLWLSMESSSKVVAKIAGKNNAMRNGGRWLKQYTK